MMKPQRTAKYYYLKFLRLQGDPHSLALGVAIGLFIGVTPTIPLHTALVVLFCWILRGNLIAALIAATAISNPITWIPQYHLSWYIGNQLIPGKLTWEKIKELLDFLTSGAGIKESIAAIAQMGVDAIGVMVLGGILLAIPFTIGGYFFSFNFFATIRRKRSEKHILK
ncbi:MAG: DUF2062 domain-containing protein [Desulfobulbaceae bacterium]|nr:DUF2062 domain-containing protein [Desulfobulbaceae bacterium]HIJ78847.1 DUF2062 domain-containing protein [Deltaproteobacteria bacterium]